MGEGFACLEGCTRGRCLHLVERTLHESCLGRAVIVGIDDISGERILLRSPLSVHIVHRSFRNCVFQDVEDSGSRIVASADVLGTACRKTYLGTVLTVDLEIYDAVLEDKPVGRNLAEILVIDPAAFEFLIVRNENRGGRSRIERGEKPY